MLSGVLSALVRVDAAAFSALRAHRWSSLDGVMWLVSAVARGGVLWMVMGLVLAARQPARWMAFVQLLLAIGLAALLADSVFKPLVGRSRPFEIERQLRTYGPRPDSRSFPSGHAATAFAGAAAISQLMPEATAGFWLLAAVVAFSRIYLGVHYPLDVLGGMLVGIAAAAFVIGGTCWTDPIDSSSARSSRDRRRAER